MSILDRLKKGKEAKQEAQEKAAVAAGMKPEKKAKKSEKKAEKQTTKTEKKAEKKPVKVGKTGDAYKVLIEPIITEKATVTGTYLFAVALNATKPEIAKAVQQVYGVKPKSVRVMNVAGKSVRWNMREGQRKNWKKAIVRLNAGETINVYEGT